MPLKTMHDLLVHELKDIYSAEKQITRALPKMAKAATNPKLAAAFEKHLAETQDQLAKLDQVFTLVDASPGRKVCKAMQGLVEEGAELLEEKEKAEPAVFDAALIGAAQRVEHYEISAYGTARSFAEQCGYADAARILQQILDQEGKTNEALNQLALSLVNPKAEQTGGATA